MQDKAKQGRMQGDALLFLTDDELRNGIEAMYFAYRGFTSDPDRILEEQGYGRAHHRAIHFINRSPGLIVNELIGILGVSKQSLNRVLRRLIFKGHVSSMAGADDRRTKRLYLTDAGKTLESQLSQAQRNRVREAYRSAGPDAVSGFCTVLEQLMDPQYRIGGIYRKRN